MVAITDLAFYALASRARVYCGRMAVICNFIFQGGVGHIGGIRGLRLFPHFILPASTISAFQSAFEF